MSCHCGGRRRIDAAKHHHGTFGTDVRFVVDQGCSCSGGAVRKAGGFRDTLNAMLADKATYRSPGALDPGYEQPEIVTDADIETYLRPLVRTEQRTRDVQRFVEAFDNKHTRAIEPQLRALRAPTLIAWATDDIYFPVQWAHWLAR